MAASKRFTAPATTLLVCALALLPAAAAAEPPGFAERLGSVRETFHKQAEKGRTVGGVLLVQHRGELVLHEPFGLRDREAGQPMAVDDIFRIYSLSKPVTSVAAMLLVEEGKLALDESVSKHLPELAGLEVATERFDPETGEEHLDRAPAKRDMTLRDLLRHTSGLLYDWTGQSAVHRLYHAAPLWSEGVTIADTVKVLGGLPLAHSPGEAFEYSFSTDVVGRLIEVVSGQRFDRFLAERVFGPLGMQDTGFYVEPERRSRLAALYRRTRPGARLERAPASDSEQPPTWLSGGGGLRSTAADYLRFCRMILAGGVLDGKRFLKPESVAEMSRDQLGPARASFMDGYGFGLGFAILERPDPWLRPGFRGQLHWNGATGTTFFIDPGQDLIGVFLIQTFGDREPREKFTQGVYRALAGD